MTMPKSKLGFLLAGVYIFITVLFFIYARFACSTDALYCGMIGFIPVLPSMLLLMPFIGIFSLFNDTTIVVAYVIPLLINIVLVYFIGSVIQNKFSQKTAKIISLLAIGIAVIAMVILGARYFNKSDIWKPDNIVNVNNPVNSGNYCQQDSDCVLAPQYQGCCPNGCEIEAVNIETKNREEEIRNEACSLKDYICPKRKCESSVSNQAVCEQNRCVMKEKQSEIISQDLISINCVKDCSNEELSLILSIAQKVFEVLKNEFPYMAESALKSRYNIVVDSDAADRSFVDYKNKIATLTKVYSPTIAHEISHLFIAEYFGIGGNPLVNDKDIFYPNGPAWLQEGLAMYLEYQIDDARRQESVNNRFNIPAYLENFESGSDLKGWYSASWIMTRDLIGQDRDKFKRLVDCAKNLPPLSPPLPPLLNNSWEQCFNEIYKTEWKSFYEKWSLNNSLE